GTLWAGGRRLWGAMLWITASVYRRASSNRSTYVGRTLSVSSGAFSWRGLYPSRPGLLVVCSIRIGICGRAGMELQPSVARGTHVPPLAWDCREAFSPPGLVQPTTMALITASRRSLPALDLRQQQRCRSRGYPSIGEGTRYCASGIGLSAGGSIWKVPAVRHVIEKAPTVATSATRCSSPIVLSAAA